MPRKSDILPKSYISQPVVTHNWKILIVYCIKTSMDHKLGLLEYDKNNSHNYFAQY